MAQSRKTNNLVMKLGQAGQPFHEALKAAQAVWTPQATPPSTTPEPRH